MIHNYNIPTVRYTFFVQYCNLRRSSKNMDSQNDCSVIMLIICAIIDYCDWYHSVFHIILLQYAKQIVIIAIMVSIHCIRL